MNYPELVQISLKQGSEEGLLNLIEEEIEGTD